MRRKNLKGVLNHKAGFHLDAPRIQTLLRFGRKVFQGGKGGFAIILRQSGFDRREIAPHPSMQRTNGDEALQRREKTFPRGLSLSLAGRVIRCGFQSIKGIA